MARADLTVTRLELMVRVAGELTESSCARTECSYEAPSGIACSPSDLLSNTNCYSEEARVRRIGCNRMKMENRPATDPITLPRVICPTRIKYPISDGIKLADNGFQSIAAWETFGHLCYLFDDRPDSYVRANMAIYYEEGNPDAGIVPSVAVLEGERLDMMDHCKVWDPCCAKPIFVLEVAYTWANRRPDGLRRRHVFEQLGVPECWWYDPTGDFDPFTDSRTEDECEPVLEGYRLENGHYSKLQPLADGWIHSDALDLDLGFEGIRLRIRDPEIRRPFLTAGECSLEAQVAQIKLARLMAKKRKLEAEYAALVSKRQNSN